jgi:hypothetical protein
MGVFTSFLTWDFMGFHGGDVIMILYYEFYEWDFIGISW